MNKLPGEKEMPFDIAGLTVTTHRVRLRAVGGGSLSLKSIMLEHVSSLSAGTQSNDGFLWLAVLVLVLAIAALFFVSDGVGIFMVGVVVTVFFLAIYFGTRRAGLRIFAEDGSCIHLRTPHLPESQLVYFIDRIEEAKEARRAALLDPLQAKYYRTQIERMEAANKPGQVSTSQDRRTYRVSRGGEELEQMSLSTIKSLIGAGELTSEDFFLDAGANEWKPLATLPGIL